MFAYGLKPTLMRCFATFLISVAWVALDLLLSYITHAGDPSAAALLAFSPLIIMVTVPFRMLFVGMIQIIVEVVIWLKQRNQNA